MAITKDDLAKLVQLQEKDAVADDLRRSLEKIPEDIAAIRGEVEAEQSRLNGVHERAKEVQARKKEKENDMAQHEGAIRKHQSELNQVKSNDAFKALLKEIEESKQAVSDLETEILTLMDEAEVVVLDEKKLKAELKDFEVKQEQQVKILEGRQGELEVKLRAAEAERAVLACGVPAELSKLYEATRERRGGIAMTLLVGNGCQQCHMKLPPQVLINVKKGTSIVTCDSCQRILHDLGPVPSGTSA